jgi:hypothetical protein
LQVPQILTNFPNLNIKSNLLFNNKLLCRFLINLSANKRRLSKLMVKLYKINNLHHF